ncbi:MAG TPA: CerR family C-terminal domain-containing protein [Gemmataceae bacterium]|nr:CerR family C-terminal domain-containing protein [Gemmataceae bacterium]
MLTQHKRQRTKVTSRERLLEAAGQVFAEKGFDRATGKEICEKAGTNTAAINYYFVGMKELYAAVVWEAHNRFVTFEAASAAVAGKGDAKARLEAILDLAVRTITGPEFTSWALRVLGREVVAPTSALDELRNQQIVPKARLLKSIVGDLMGLPVDDPAVARGCISVIAPCLMMLVFDRGTLQQVFPQLGFGPENAKSLVSHLIHFALAGLEAVGREARKSGNYPPDPS